MKAKQKAFFVDPEIYSTVRQALPQIKPKRKMKEVVAECVLYALPVILRADEMRAKFMSRVATRREIIQPLIHDKQGSGIFRAARDALLRIPDGGMKVKQA